MTPDTYTVWAVIDYPYRTEVYAPLGVVATSEDDLEHREVLLIDVPDRVRDLLDSLEFDNGVCATCGEVRVGAYLDEREDAYGRERAGAAWWPTWVVQRGDRIWAACEDCSLAFEPQSPSRLDHLHR